MFFERFVQKNDTERGIHVKIGEIWNKVKTNWIVSAIVTGLIGLVLLLFPSSTLTSICYCIGGLTIAMGVIRVVRYFQQEHRYPYFFQSDLVIGLVTIGLGLFMITSPITVMTLLPYLFGILLVGCGIGNILRSVDAKKNGFTKWGFLLGMAILSVAAGAVILNNPFGAIETVVAVTGGCLIYESVADLLTTFLLNKKIKTIEKKIEQTQA